MVQIDSLRRVYLLDLLLLTQNSALNKCRKDLHYPTFTEWALRTSSASRGTRLTEDWKILCPRFSNFCLYLFNFLYFVFCIRPPLSQEEQFLSSRLTENIFHLFLFSYLFFYLSKCFVFFSQEEQSPCGRLTEDRGRGSLLRRGSRPPPMSLAHLLTWSPNTNTSAPLSTNTRVPEIQNTAKKASVELAWKPRFLSNGLASQSVRKYVFGTCTVSLHYTQKLNCPCRPQCCRPLNHVSKK